MKTWALILGSSSGFGEAVSVYLAEKGMNIAGVHLDRRQTLPQVAAITAKINAAGAKALFFNQNAADPETRKKVVAQLQQETAGKHLKCVMHSLAFGSLKPFVDEKSSEMLTQKQMDMTLDVMAHSLVYWVQDLFAAGLLGPGSQIFAMTSAGGHRVWPTYGAVSAAKAALESHVRQLALELSPRQIAVNAIQAGVTDTPALRRIPGSDQMKDFARLKNPGKRLTETRDVAQAIWALCQNEGSWLTGNVVRVDGGEDLIG